MKILESDGKLFGVVNVVDAVVVITAVVIGAVAITAGFGLSATADQGPGTDGATYATVDLGTQPIPITNTLAEGDTDSSDAGTLTITDVHLAPGDEGIHTLVRVKLEGWRNRNGALSYRGQPPRLGRSVTIVTPRYNVSGTIRAVGDAETLPTDTTRVMIRTTVPTETVSRLSPGTQLRIAGRPVGTIHDRQPFVGPSPGERRLQLLVELETYRNGERRFFGATELTRTASVRLPTTSGAISGQVVAFTEATSFDRRTRRVLVTDEVTATAAQQLSPGDSFTVAGRSIGTVESVTLYDTAAPNRNRVYAGVELETLPVGDDPHFGDTPVRLGAKIPFETDAYELTGTIRGVDTHSGFEQETRQVVVTDEVAADVAAAISVGDSYRVSGRSIGTVETVASYGTSVPDRTQVYVGLELETLSVGGRTRFGQTPLTTGATVPFETDSYELNGTVVRLGTTEQRGTRQQRTVTLTMENTPPGQLRAIRDGAIERGRHGIVARINSVETEPADVVLTSDSGDIHYREHPVNKDLTITATLTVRETETATRFKGKPLYPGSTVTLDLGGETIEATVRSL